jgi:hypothetical protein
MTISLLRKYGMPNRRTLFVATAVIAAALSLVVRASAKEDRAIAKRARPPKWSADVKGAFFDDARTKLVGKRPDYEGAATVADAKANATSAGNGGANAASGWSKLIDAETIETEIKRLAPLLAKATATSSDFQGGGFKDCRRLFSELAVLFAVAADYDGDVRWKEAAPALRDLFSRAGHNCKVGTDQTFVESSQRKQDLTDLISGSRPKLPKAEKDAPWGQTADRPPLMQRLNIAHEERLTKWLANQGEFEKNRDDVRHEAQLMAVIADVISREGFDYWDEDDYKTHVRELREAAVNVSAAAEKDDFERAQKAINSAKKACADCHELYRG